jgi:putative acetyltransferase
MGHPFIIRPEAPGDAAAVHAVHAAAFPTDVEARVVDLLRPYGKALVSLVAVAADGAIVGHVLFSPVTIESKPDVQEGAGLAPLAVLPSYQGQGIGSELVRSGIDACRARRVPFLVVLGNPRYYGRFGFETASDRNLANEYGADAAFMVQELILGSLPASGGLVRYAPEFNELGV